MNKSGKTEKAAASGLRSIVGIIVTISVFCARATEVSSSFHCISLNVTAGDRQTSTADVRYRASGSNAWRPGHPLVLDKESGKYVGSIVDLSKDTSYELEISTSGTTGTGSQSVSRYSISTLADKPAVTESVALYVSPNGNDSNPGTKAEPFRTIQKASSVVKPGEVVVVAAGVYREQVLIISSGTAENLITFQAAPGGEVILDPGPDRDHGFVLRDVHNVQIRGFTVRDCTASGILVKDGSSHVFLDLNVISDAGNRYFDSAIEVGPDCSRIIISNNRIWYNKGPHNGGRMGIALRKTAGGHIIYGNRISGGGLIKDGIGGEPNFELNGGAHRDSDIYKNQISGCKDDGIESEGANTNVRIWGNHIEDCLVGIAVAPVIKGPCYVWRNEIVNCGPAFKLGEGDRMGHGHLFLYHNTAFTTVPEDSGYAGSGGEGLFTHVRARNNLIVSNGLLFYDKRSQRSNSFDYDLLYSTDKKRFMAWGKDRKKISLEQARDLGFWLHAISADPLLVNAPVDLKLTPGSPAVDGGVVIPNFNDGYLGSAPDIGAYECF